MFFPPFVWRHIKNYMLQEIREKKEREWRVIQQLPRYSFDYTISHSKKHFYLIYKFLNVPDIKIVKEYQYFQPFKKRRQLSIYAMYNNDWQRDARRWRREIGIKYNYAIKQVSPGFKIENANY